MANRKTILWLLAWFIALATATQASPLPPQGAAPGKTNALPEPTPPQKRGDRPAPGPAAQGAASAPAAPSAGLPSSSVAVLNTPQHAPDQLDFGSVADGAPVTRTFTLLTNAAGYVSVTIPPGPFRVSEFREMGPLPAGSKNLPLQSQPAAVSGVRSRIRYQEGQNGPYQWNMAPNTQMQVDVVVAPRSQNTQLAGVKTVIMYVTGPGPHGNWVITVPLRATINSSKTTSSAAGTAAPAGEHSAVEQLKLRLASLHGLKVKSGALTHNPTMMALQHAAGPSAALSGNPKTVSAASRSSATLPGHGQADPAATLSQQAVNPCQSYGKDPVLISIDNQLMQWVFSNEAHMYRFTGCNFGSPQRFLRLHFTDPSSGWTDDLPLAPTSWQNQEILAQLTLEVKGGKVVPMPDINSLEIQLIHESIPGKLWVLGKGKFRAVRGNPVPLMDIPQALIAAFPQGSPYVLVPMTNFYGVSGAMGIVRPNLNSLIPLGQDKVNLALKSGFVIDSAQLQYLVYDNQGQGSTTTADSSHLSINGNNILVNYPIDSVMQNGQPFYYSIYGLNVWVVGPKGIDPW